MRGVGHGAIEIVSYSHLIPTFHRGLVTYREVDLLIDPVTASNQQKQRVVTVVTHELAHQWVRIVLFVMEFL